jgi:hypothetical protein
MWTAQQYKWILYQSQSAAFTEVSARYTEVRCTSAGSITHSVQEVFESFHTPGDVDVQEQFFKPESLQVARTEYPTMPNVKYCRTARSSHRLVTLVTLVQPQYRGIDNDRLFVLPWRGLLVPAVTLPAADGTG